MKTLQQKYLLSVNRRILAADKWKTSNENISYCTVGYMKRIFDWLCIWDNAYHYYYRKLLDTMPKESVNTLLKGINL